MKAVVDTTKTITVPVTKYNDRVIEVDAGTIRLHSPKATRGFYVGENAWRFASIISSFLVDHLEDNGVSFDGAPLPTEAKS